jgi:hypothetical protein
MWQICTSFRRTNQMPIGCRKPVEAPNLPAQRHNLPKRGTFVGPKNVDHLHGGLKNDLRFLVLLEVFDQWLWTGRRYIEPHLHHAHRTGIPWLVVAPLFINTEIFAWRRRFAKSTSCRINPVSSLSRHHTRRYKSVEGACARDDLLEANSASFS